MYYLGSQPLCFIYITFRFGLLLCFSLHLMKSVTIIFKFGLNLHIKIRTLLYVLFTFNSLLPTKFFLLVSNQSSHLLQLPTTLFSLICKYVAKTFGKANRFKFHTSSRFIFSRVFCSATVRPSGVTVAASLFFNNLAIYF